MKESDIAHENPTAWVFRDRASGMYKVYRSGVTHSTSDCGFRLDNDGLSLAIARADYLHKHAMLKAGAK